MIMKTLYEIVMQSEQLKKNVERFAYINKFKINSTEYESYILGYERAVEDIYNFLALDNHLILEIYEKQDVTTK